MFHRDRQKWYPLDDLRERSLAGAERELIAKLWERISDDIGPLLA